MKTILLSALALALFVFALWIDGDCAADRARAAGRFDEAAELLEQR